jgi:hypothetical protein
VTLSDRLGDTRGDSLGVALGKALVDAVGHCPAFHLFHLSGSEPEPRNGSNVRAAMKRADTCNECLLAD